MSVLQQYGAMGVSIATSESNTSTQDIVNSGYGTASQLGVMLPFSRKNETEADEIGIILMAIAGYKPEEASKYGKNG